MVNMGEKLRSLRIENKLTQKQVADKIDLDDAEIELLSQLVDKLRK